MALAAPPDTAPRIAILIPAFNEEAVVGAVVRAIAAHGGYPVYVIDDASTDGTIAEATAAGARVIPLATQLGAWGATQAGLRYVLRQGFVIAVTMDADGQHDPGSLAPLLAPVLSGAADVSVGACTGRGSALRQIAWRLMKASSGLTLEDITSGFRVYNRSAMRLLSSWRATLLDYQDVGVLLLLQSRGLRIVDVEVQMHTRQVGQSRVFHSWLMVVHYMLQTLLLGLTKRQRSRQVLPEKPL
jgi:glycosyltransferase involved in cell wall biosynthesis